MPAAHSANQTTSAKSDSKLAYRDILIGQLRRQLAIDEHIFSFVAALLAADDSADGCRKIAEEVQDFVEQEPEKNLRTVIMTMINLVGAIRPVYDELVAPSGGVAIRGRKDAKEWGKSETHLSVKVPDDTFVLLRLFAIRNNLFNWQVVVEAIDCLDRQYGFRQKELDREASC